MGEHNLKCVHCEDLFSEYSCPKCGVIRDTCLDCHDEKKHKIIKNQNINLCSSPPSPNDDIDEHSSSWKMGSGQD